MSTQEPFFFGPQGSIFGVYHSANATPKRHAILIAGPLLNDNIRSHFALRQIALKLSATGYDVLRFDYAGSGNSLQPLDTVRLVDWVNNIEHAAQELKEISGARSLSIIAVRFSACLSVQLSQSITLDKIVLWDPLFESTGWLSKLRETQRAATQKLGGSEINLDREFLGQLTNASLAQDLAEMPEDGTFSQKICIVATDDCTYASQEDSLSITIHRVPIRCNWEDMNSEVLYPHQVIESICREFK